MISREDLFSALEDLKKLKRLNSLTLEIPFDDEEFDEIAVKAIKILPDFHIGKSRSGDKRNALLI